MSQSITNQILLYGDLVSQPTRAVHFFMLHNNIPFKLKVVNISKHEQNSDSFKKINPFSKVPTIITEDGNTIYESHTILRYLSQKYTSASKFYPFDSLDKRTKIDMYLDYHHLGLRQPLHPGFFGRYVAPKIGLPVNEAIVQQSEKDTPIALERFERMFLDNGNREFIVDGIDHPTIADFSAFSEIQQLRLLKFDFSRYKHIVDWMSRMEQLKGYQETFKFLIRLSNE
eukprot:gene2892-3594_t